jgi:putative transposase
VRNHARTVLASDLFVVVTATFRILYVFVVLEVGTRRILHWNVTTHPTADWTAQQFRMIVPGDQVHRFVIHDRDRIYAERVDRTLETMGLTVLKTPVRVPQANAFCERVIGTIRRECLDFIIAMSEGHVRAILREWVNHYNRGRPHASLGPGIPEGSVVDPVVGESNGHSVPTGYRVVATPILGGLHHEYSLERQAA